jgi:acyl-CoA thioester hydrolase
MTTEAKQGFVVEAHLRVRYAETDAMGVVYYANYPVWFEVARGEYCRAAGYSYAQMEKDFGIVMAVTEMGVKYRYPARYDDEIIVYVWMEKLGKASCVFGYQVYNVTNGKVCVDGFTEHAAVAADGRPKRFDTKLHEVFTPLVGIGKSQMYQNSKSK